MEQIVTTYRRDYLWPYVRVMRERPSPENYYPPPSAMVRRNVCKCHGLRKATAKRVEPIASAEKVEDPTIHLAQVGRCPEVDTMRFDQPNVFLKKLQDKYPYIYELLRTVPMDEVISRVNRDRLRSTYQVDYCKMNEYPSSIPTELLRAAGASGTAPCSEAIITPREICRPNQRGIAFRVATVTKEGTTKRDTGGRRSSFGGGGGRPESTGGLGYVVGGKEGAKGDGSSPGITSGRSEYQDAISKLGELILREKIYSRAPRK